MDSDTLKLAFPALVSLVTLLAGYYFGRRQEAVKARVAVALPKAEELGRLVQEYHQEDKALSRWFKETFHAYRTLDEAVDRFERGREFDSERKRVIELIEKRQLLVDRIRSSRVYLNQRDLDRMERYVESTEFTFLHDGMGGALFQTLFLEYFRSRESSASWDTRDREFAVIKKRLPKMYQAGD